MAVTLLLCSACELKFKPNEEAEAAVLSVQRYDRLESRYREDASVGHDY